MNWGFPTLFVLSAASYHSCTRERQREEKLTRQIKERMDDIVDHKRSSVEAPMAAKEGLKQPRPPRLVSKSSGLADKPEWLSAEEEWKRRGRDPAAADEAVSRPERQPEADGAAAAARRRGWFGLW